MSHYHVDVKIAATLYIKADSLEEAQAKLDGMFKYPAALEVSETPDEDFPISGKPFDDPELPPVSLSPAMTLWGVFEGQTLTEVA